MARLVLYRGKWCAVDTIDGKTVRTSLRTGDRAEALRRFEDLKTRAKAPPATDVGGAAEAHLARCAAKSSHEAMTYAWKALKETFAHLRPDQITPELCADYRALRRRQGVADGTVIKELSFLRAAVRKMEGGLQARFELPPSPEPRDRWLTADEMTALLAAMDDQHLRLFSVLAVTTAARTEAILQLTWDRVDFERGLIAYGRREDGRKNRIVAPMNGTARVALQAAHEVRTCEHVIEYGGGPVGSVKKGFRAAAQRAELEGVSPHILRHTAATWMAQSRVPMVEIARYLGHSDPKITFRIYAKHSPDFLRDAAAAVELKGVFLGAIEPKSRNEGRTGERNPRPRTTKRAGKQAK